MPDPRRFEPTPTLGIWLTFALGVVVLGVAVPIVVWWQGLDASIPLQVGMFSVGLLAWALKLWFGRRHRGTLTVDDGGLGVDTNAGTNRVAWTDIHRLHRFGDRLVIETTPPHRRYTLLLDGHEDHLSAIVDTIRARAPATDLRWLDTLSKLLE